MKHIVRLFLASTLVFTLIMTGCSSKTNPQIDALQGQISQLQKENEKLLTQVQDLQKQIEVLNQKEAGHTQEEAEKEPDEVGQTVEYPVYSSDIDTLEKEEIGFAKVEEGKDLLTILNALADTLSETNFEGLPIDVTEIKDVNGKKIAIIDLREDATKEIGWMSAYFQGSTGGAMTASSICETFLQKELSKDVPWIDGIQIIYEGQVTETEHMPELGKIIYR
ncbi:MAG: bZIP transcription factor [Cellulosilyticaceae bacterium]